MFISFDRDKSQGIKTMHTMYRSLKSAECFNNINGLEGSFDSWTEVYDLLVHRVGALGKVYAAFHNV